MRKFALVLAGVASCFAGTGIASAQNVTPDNTNFTADKPVGGTGVSFFKPGAGTHVCDLTITGDTDPGSGGKVNTGDIYGGTNTGPSICPLLTVDASPFRIVSIITSGVLYGGEIDLVTVKLAGNTICVREDMPFTIDSSGYIVFDTYLEDPSLDPALRCVVDGELLTNNANVVGTN